MTKCYEFELQFPKRTITTFVYSDTGNDIESRFTPHKVSKIKEIKGIIMKEYFEKKFGQGTAFDLDYGKLLIIALLIYIAFFK